MALPEISAMIDSQIDEREGKRMEVHQICSRNLQPEIRCGRKAAVQQMPENILRRFKRLILPAGLDEKLLGQNLLHGIPCLRRDFFQMPVRVDADQIPQPHARTDERGKAAAIRAVCKLDAVRRSCGQGWTSADDRACLIGDLAAAHRRLKHRIGKPQRQMVRGNMKRIVQHQKRTAQQRARAFCEAT